MATPPSSRRIKMEQVTTMVGAKVFFISGEVSGRVDKFLYFEGFRKRMVLMRGIDCCTAASGVLPLARTSQRGAGNGLGNRGNQHRAGSHAAGDQCGGRCGRVAACQRLRSSESVS